MEAGHLSDGRADLLALLRQQGFLERFTNQIGFVSSRRTK